MGNYFKHLKLALLLKKESNYNNSPLEYIVNQRFYVRLDGSNVNAEELWQFVDQLDFKTI